jgi:hypothetical protein
MEIEISASQFPYNCVILTTAAVVEQAQQYPGRSLIVYLLTFSNTIKKRASF